MVQEGKSGYLFRAGDLPDFVRAIHLFNKHKEEMIASGEDLRASVADYALDKYTDHLVALAENVIQRREARTIQRK